MTARALRRRRLIPIALVGLALLSWACSVHSVRTRRLFFRPAGTQEFVYRTAPELRLLVYPPSRARHSGLVVFIHGGAWRAPGADLPLYQDWQEPLSQHGLRAASVEHRVLPQFNGHDMQADVMRALRFLNDRAETLAFPPHKIALIGFSSGGHLAALAGIGATVPDRNMGRHADAASPRPTGGERTVARPAPQPVVRAVVGYYSPLDLVSLYRTSDVALRSLLAGLVAPRPGAPSQAATTNRPGDSGVPGALSERDLALALRKLSPLHALHARAPAFLLLHGDRDELVPIQQSRAFVRRARSLGVRAELQELSGHGHNFDLSRRSRVRRAERDALAFVAGALAEARP